MILGVDFDYMDCYNEEHEIAEPVMVPSTHPLHILHTSGTTGNPKGIIRDTGGTATTLMYAMKNIMGV